MYVRTLKDNNLDLNNVMHTVAFLIFLHSFKPVQKTFDVFRFKLFSSWYVTIRTTVFMFPSEKNLRAVSMRVFNRTAPWSLRDRREML